MEWCDRRDLMDPVGRSDGTLPLKLIAEFLQPPGVDQPPPTLGPHPTPPPPHSSTNIFNVTAALPSTSGASTAYCTLLPSAAAAPASPIRAYRPLLSNYRDDDDAPLIVSPNPSHLTRSSSFANRTSLKFKSPSAKWYLVTDHRCFLLHPRNIPHRSFHKRLRVQWKSSRGSLFLLVITA